MGELLTYHRGEWLTREDGRQENPDGDVDREMREAGWDVEHTYGPATTPTNPSLELTIWAHSQSRPMAHPEGCPRYIVEIGTDTRSDDFGAIDTIDLMDLLGRWLPTIAVAAEIDLAQSKIRPGRRE